MWLSERMNYAKLHFTPSPSHFTVHFTALYVSFLSFHYLSCTKVNINGRKPNFLCWNLKHCNGQRLNAADGGATSMMCKTRCEEHTRRSDEGAPPLLQVERSDHEGAPHGAAHRSDESFRFGSLHCTSIANARRFGHSFSQKKTGLNWEPSRTDRPPVFDQFLAGSRADRLWGSFGPDRGSGSRFDRSDQPVRAGFNYLA